MLPFLVVVARHGRGARAGCIIDRQVERRTQARGTWRRMRSLTTEISNACPGRGPSCLPLCLPACLCCGGRRAWSVVEEKKDEEGHRQREQGLWRAFCLLIGQQRSSGHARPFRHNYRKGCVNVSSVCVCVARGELVYLFGCACGREARPWPQRSTARAWLHAHDVKDPGYG